MITRLPPEIIQHIINELIELSIVTVSESKTNELLRKGISVGFQSSRVSSYAAVSREWQQFIEIHTFRRIKVTSQELEVLRRIADQRRQTYIVVLSYTVLLPPYDVEARRRQENAEEQKANSAEFTSAVKNLFAELKDWHPQRSQEEGIRQLHLDCHSPSDEGWRQLEQTSEGSRDWQDLGRKRYQDNHIKFSSLEETNLAIVNAFTQLIATGSGRAIDPSAFCILASRMPQMTWFGGSLSDLDGNSKRRIQRRSDFAENLLSKMPQGLRVLDLAYYNDTPRDQRLSPRCFESDLRRDPFSCSIRTLSQRLVSLSLLDCVIDRDLFWPLQKEPSQDLSLTWPNLRDVVLKPRGILADGTWLFEKDPNYPDDSDESEDDDDDDDDSEEIWRQPKFVTFRRKPVYPLFDEFYLSMANAAGNMPKLESLSIAFHFDFPDRPDNQFEFKDDGNGKRTILWHSSPEYRPSSEVMEAWRTAKGSEVDITFSSEPPVWMSAVS